MRILQVWSNLEDLLAFRLNTVIIETTIASKSHKQVKGHGDSHHDLETVICLIHSNINIVVEEEKEE